MTLLRCPLLGNIASVRYNQAHGKIIYKIKKLSEKNGDIEFSAEVPVELLEEYSLAALAKLAEDFALPGFRKGKVPQEKVREHIGEMSLLEDAANEALRDAMPQIAEDRN